MVVTSSMKDKAHLLATISSAPCPPATAMIMMPDPAPLLSFLEDAGDEGVPRYDEAAHEGTGTPPSSIGPSSITSGGTRPPSLLSDQSPAFSQRHCYTLADPEQGRIGEGKGRQTSATPRAAQVDAWRREQLDPDGATDAATAMSPPSRDPLSDQLSALLHLEGENQGQGATPIRFEHMTDAEIGPSSVPPCLRSDQDIDSLALVSHSSAPLPIGAAAPPRGSTPRPRGGERPARTLEHGVECAFVVLEQLVSLGSAPATAAHHRIDDDGGGGGGGDYGATRALGRRSPSGCVRSETGRRTPRAATLRRLVPVDYARGVLSLLLIMHHGSVGVHDCLPRIDDAPLDFVGGGSSSKPGAPSPNPGSALRL